MSTRKLQKPNRTRATEVEARFAKLLSTMKMRYLAAGYELDEVHLAEILGVHDGVLRKGKTISVSPALARAVGKIWGVDLNWLLLGRGEAPGKTGSPSGIEQLPQKTRIARGRWDEHKVRQMISERKLSHKELSRLLETDTQRAGNLVRGTLRDAGLRVRLARFLNAEPESLFLCSRAQAVARKAPREKGSGQRKTMESVSVDVLRGAVNRLLDEHLQNALVQEISGTHNAKQLESAVVKLSIPPAPGHLDNEERKRYEHNRRVLEKWSSSDEAFLVPGDVAGRYCREVVGFYEGDRLSDVGGILKDFIQEDVQETSRPDNLSGRDDPEELSLTRGVIVAGSKEIKLDDPELQARLPEYLASKVGRSRLLSWLRDNVPG